MEAARQVCNALGIDTAAFYEAMTTFEGAARRFEKISERTNFISFRDFAHAPSKLRATLKGAREQFKNHYIIGVFELHTFSSLSQSFLSEYENSMNPCDAAAVFYSNHALALKRLPELDPQVVKDAFNRLDLNIYSDNALLQQWIQEQIAINTDKPICLLLMSSGTFDGMALTF